MVFHITAPYYHVIEVVDFIISVIIIMKDNHHFKRSNRYHMNNNF